MKIPFTSFQIKSTRNATIEDLVNGSSELALLGLSDGRPQHIQPKTAYNMSEKNLDLGKAVGDIAATISALKKGIEAGEELDFDNPLISLLNNPLSASAVQFWKAIAESYLLTNEAWIVARGRVQSEPVELVAIKPYDLRVEFDQRDGLPSYIETKSPRDRRFYYREIINGKYRYIERSGMNEIIPVIGLTSMVDDWRGRSVLAKLFYDYSLSTNGKRHNSSLLKNGMRTTGILSPSESSPNGGTWPVEAIKKLAEKLRSFNQGPGNAGNIVVSNVPMKIDGLSQNNRDMDFFNLLGVARESIYNLYSYPLPLVLSATMTLDNYTVAQQAFYTEAVFPVYREIAGGIMDALGPRFGYDPAVAKLSFSETDIEALRPVRVASMVRAKDTEAVSVNEIRKAGGYENSPDGDVILVSAGKLPLSTVGDPVSFNGADE